MNVKEKLAVVLGAIIVLYGSYAGRDLTNINEIMEGSAMLALFLSIFIFLAYINKRGIGD